MTLAYWVVVGLLAGWAGGRLLAPTGAGVAGDLVAGVVGSVSVAWVVQAIHPDHAGFALEIVLAGLSGALVVTFVHRAYADRFRSAVVKR